jgi:Uma2 family endonuclease
MQKATGLITAEELERLPNDGYRYELVRGRLVRMSLVNVQHAEIVAQLIFLLKQHVRDRSVGLIGADLGVKLETDPDTVRGPDVVFVRRERIPATQRRGFFVGAPDLAIEVLSPDDRPGEVGEKVDEYLDHGTVIMLVVNPDKRNATIYRRLAAPVTLDRVDDVLDLDEAVPGFHCTLGEIFE